MLLLLQARMWSQVYWCTRYHRVCVICNRCNCHFQFLGNGKWSDEHYCHSTHTHSAFSVTAKVYWICSYEMQEAQQPQKKSRLCDQIDYINPILALLYNSFGCSTICLLYSYERRQLSKLILNFFYKSGSLIIIFIPMADIYLFGNKLLQQLHCIFDERT